MAVRNIRLQDDEILKKPCKPVKEINERIITLLDDMQETMYLANGVGLAAPQVGVLRQVVVIDVGEGIIELINPEIISREGEQVGYEGCLSVPGVMGIVARPEKVTVRALNRNAEEFTIEGEGLLARALCHEIDHLSGHLYVELVEGDLVSNDYTEEEEE